MASAFGDFDILLFDIEGTVCPISFVKDVLFPYALDSLPQAIEERWDTPEFSQYRDAFPEQYRTSKTAFRHHVQDLIARDVKAPYLKALQGHLWKHGYETGELQAPLFSDVGPFFQQTIAEGKRIMIYSSGSVPAQKLLFGHTNLQPTNMKPFISDWFDTVNAGPKTSTTSYQAILSKHSDVQPNRWLFFSDNLLEVKAALESGMLSLPVARPGNAPLPQENTLSKHAIADFTAHSASSGSISLKRLASQGKS